ncbi:hypothetical protein JOM56_014355 [Amanita muscaria]
MCLIVGDMGFHSQRRFWSQGYSNAGVKTYGYLYTEPLTEYTIERSIDHIYSVSLIGAFGFIPRPHGHYCRPVSTNPSTAMVDYWISFATSLDPNDGRGTPRPIWEPYTCENQASVAALQLNSQNLSMIPDDYRKEQIEFINSDPLVWLQ